MSTINIKIMNWRVYNPRKDIKRPHWFALSNSIFESHELSDFTSDEFKAWIYILCQASKANKSNVFINYAFAERQTGLCAQILRTTIGKLIALKIIMAVDNSVVAGELFEKPNDSDDLKDDSEAHVQDFHAPVRNLHAPVRDFHATLHYTTLQNTTLQNNNTNTTTAVARNSRHRQQPLKFNSLDDLISSFDKETLNTWGELYPDANFIRRQSTKAWAWYRVNPVKQPKTIKGWHRALSHWFESDWPKYIKTLDSHSPKSTIDIAQILKDLESESATNDTK